MEYTAKIFVNKWITLHIFLHIIYKSLLKKTVILMVIASVLFF